MPDRGAHVLINNEPVTDIRRSTLSRDECDGATGAARRHHGRSERPVERRRVAKMNAGVRSSRGACSHSVRVCEAHKLLGLPRLRPFRPCRAVLLGLHLSSGDEFGRPNAECDGECRHGYEGGSALGALDSADVVAVDAGLKSKALLREVALIA